MHRLGVKSQICPFFLETRDFYDSDSNRTNIKVAGIKITNMKISKSIYLEIKNQIPTQTRITRVTLDPVKPDSTRSKFPKAFQNSNLTKNSS